MDIASLLGLIFGALMVVFGIISGDLGFAAIFNFFDLPSVIITIGGSISGVLGAYKLADFVNGFKSFKLVLKADKQEAGEVIKNIIDLSNVARKEGLLALDEASNNIDDPFLKKGLMLVVDGTEPELARGIMETELVCIEQRHQKVISFWEKWGELAPAWGMIGTLIGLVNMLKNLSDASTIGPNMAVALLTTLYGSLIANWLCNPVATKMKENNANEIMLKEVMVEGLLSIQAGENPRVIEEKLKSFLAPKLRETLKESAGGDE